jgi:hypothetical protein
LTGTVWHSGKIGLITLVVLVVLVVFMIAYWGKLSSLVSGSSGPEVLSVESFECVFALPGTAGVSRLAGGEGQFNIEVRNLSEDNLSNIYVEITARHPDSRSNTHSLVTQLSPASLKPGKPGRFKGSIAAPQMALANASVDKLLCLMKISLMSDGELQAIGVRNNGLDLVPATEVAAPIVL